VASGWEKGIVEKNVQDSRRRVWIEAKTQVFSSFAELNAWLDVRCRTLWSEIEHPDYTAVTLAEALEQEQIYLMPMPTPFDGYVEVVARVSSTCLVTDGGAKPILGTLSFSQQQSDYSSLCRQGGCLYREGHHCPASTVTGS